MATQLAPAPSMSYSPGAPCWDIDQLAQEAKLHWSRIQEHAKSVTIDYWRLGHVLELARDNFPRGKWEPWLAFCEITPYRASQARALARAFRSPDELAELSLENALAAARLKLGRTAANADRKLRRRLNSIRKAPRTAAPKVEASAARAALAGMLDLLVADAQALRRVAATRNT